MIGERERKLEQGGVRKEKERGSESRRIIGKREQQRVSGDSKERKKKSEQEEDRKEWKIKREEVRV